jgi:hypothetical protein
MPQRSPYEYYLETLGKWPTSIALASQWLIHINFDGIRGLMSNLQGAIKDREQSSWNINDNVTQKLIDGSLQYSDSTMTGCIFARQVSLPGDSISVSNQGLDYGGFMAPAVADTRGKYEPLSITLLETNASFLDFVIRPWLIMVGYNGLVARAPNSPKYVKAPYINVVMYAKLGAGNGMGIRKIYSFENAAPIGIGGETYSYAEEGLRYSDVKFAYDRYSILDGNSRDFINLS